MALSAVVVRRSGRVLPSWRAWALVCVFMAALFVPSAPPVSARETVSGHIEVGHFESGHTVCLRPPSQGCVPPELQGFDRYVFTVDPDHRDRIFYVNGTGYMHNLNIYFYTGSDNKLKSYTSSDPDEIGIVPSTAAYAIVVLFEGLDTDFTFQTGKHGQT